MRLGLLFVAAALVALAPARSDARIVSKCELRAALSAALDLPDESEREETLARVYCLTRILSGLDTQKVRLLGENPATPILAARHARAAPENNFTLNLIAEEPAAVQPTNPNIDEAEDEVLEDIYKMLDDDDDVKEKDGDKEYSQMEDEVEEGGKRKKIPQSRKGSTMRSRAGVRIRGPAGRRGQRQRSGRPSVGLYGLFQLSDTIHCDSGRHSSRNLCNTACSTFIDNDIADDVACLLSSRLPGRRVIRACRRVDESVFSDCP